ncbi:MAG: T9SS type A sorting domain-containing protein, partial [Bacteroidota bacterium]|nr:T9SS type A sorting domain-containing protein [Bacteroidota bacterium]
NTGLPASYSGATTLIDPADGDIIWNAEANRWEVTFDVTGFGAFFVQTNTTVATNPNTVNYFNGSTQGSSNILNWRVTCTNATTTFGIERSSDGVTFTNIGTVTAAADRCLQPFAFTDASPLSTTNYYRLRITDNTGNVSFSDIISIPTGSQFVTRLYPNLIVKGANVTVSCTALKGSLVVYDALGRMVVSRTLTTGVQNIKLGLVSPGLYFYIILDDTVKILTGKIVVQ